MDVLTEEQFKDALPPKMKRAVNSSLILAINNTLSAPEEYENFRDNLIKEKPTCYKICIHLSVLQKHAFII